MKTFYTQRDIEEMHLAGTTRIEIDDNVVLTDLAREAVDALGISLVSPNDRSNSAAPSNESATSSAEIDLGHAVLASRIKAGVIARLGTNDYNHLLDQLIPQILARLKASPGPDQAQTSSASRQNDY